MKKYYKISTAACTTVISALSFGCNICSAAPSQPKSGQFDQIYQVMSPRYTMKAVDKVTFKGEKFKRESEDRDEFVLFNDIQDGQSFYRYIPSQNAALRTEIKSTELGALEELQQQTVQMTVGAQKTGEATVNGFSCDEYTRTFADSTKVTLWLSKDVRFPYVIKTVYSAPDQDLTRVSLIDNVKLDIPVPDDTFLIPKGTKIVDQPLDNSGTQPAPAGGLPSDNNAQGNSTSK